MYGMTGYGQAKVNSPYGIFYIEVFSTNHKFCEISVKLPYEFAILEYRIKELIRNKVVRGKFNVSFRWESKKQVRGVEIDDKLAEDYLKALKKIGHKLHLKFDAGVNLIANFPEVIRIEEGHVGADKLWQFLKKGISEACNSLVAMRRKEGEVIEKQFEKSISAIEKDLRSIQRSKSTVVDRYTRLLHEKAKKLALRIDEIRFAS